MLEVPLIPAQKLFLEQARSDYKIYSYLRGQDHCHRLHYLQMCTEKLAKVYFWRHGRSPGRNHKVFKNFLDQIEVGMPADLHKIFGHKDRRQFGLQKKTIFDLAERLQNLVPAGNNGPNPEYPWPPDMPTTGPLIYKFPEWLDWNETTAGRRLKYFVENTLDNYETLFP